MIGLLIVALISLGACVVSIAALRPVCERVGLVDQPGGRKRHDVPTPLLGGLAIVLGILFSTLFWPVDLLNGLPIAIATLLLFVVALIDDLHELSPTVRFAAQISASIILVYWGQVTIEDFGALFGSQAISLGIFAGPVTVFCIVGVINAINMVDGMDGLAISLTLTALAGLAVAMSLAGQSGISLTATAAMIGAAVGFAWFNIRWRGRPARVFLGDSGSMVLGLLLAWLLIVSSQGEAPAISPVTALWLLAVPLLDTVYVMLRRIRFGKSPFAGGRDHVHHLLLDSGLSVPMAWLVLTVVASVLAAAAILMDRLAINEGIQFAGFLVTAASYWIFADRSWRRRPAVSNPSRA